MALDGWSRSEREAQGLAYPRRWRRNSRLHRPVQMRYTPFICIKTPACEISIRRPCRSVLWEVQLAAASTCTSLART